MWEGETWECEMDEEGEDESVTRNARHLCGREARDWIGWPVRRDHSKYKGRTKHADAKNANLQFAIFFEEGRFVFVFLQMQKITESMIDGIKIRG